MLSSLTETVSAGLRVLGHVPGIAWTGSSEPSRLVGVCGMHAMIGAGGEKRGLTQALEAVESPLSDERAGPVAQVAGQVS